MTLRTLAKILDNSFAPTHLSGLPDGFIRVKHDRATKRRGEQLSIAIGNRDIVLDSRGSVIESGTCLLPRFQIKEINRMKVKCLEI